MTVVPLHVVPDPDDPDQALPFVDIAVDGTVTRALLDSGSARTTVAPPVNAVVRESGASGGTGAFGVRCDDAAKGEEWTTTVRLGDRTLKDVAIDVRTGAGGRDVLGQDVLARFCCEYRFRDRELRLDGASLGTDAHPIQLGENGHVYLDLEWPPSGITASAVFDTGASVTVVDLAFAEAHPELFTQSGTSRGTDSTGATRETPMVQMTGPRLLGRDFDDTTAALVDLGPVNQTIQRRMDLIIGWPVLRQAIWTIDHARRRAVVAD